MSEQDILTLAEQPIQQQAPAGYVPAPQLALRGPSQTQRILALEARLSGLESGIRELLARQPAQNQQAETRVSETALLLKAFSDINSNAQAQAQANATAQINLTKDLLGMAMQLRGQAAPSEGAQIAEAITTVAPVVVQGLKDLAGGGVSGRNSPSPAAPSPAATSATGGYMGKLPEAKPAADAKPSDPEAFPA